jgi:ribonuclease D
MAVYFHEEDLPADVLAPGPLAVDTETMGLVTQRDRLCLCRSATAGDEHLVRFANGSAFDAPNLKAVLADPARVKLYHLPGSIWRRSSTISASGPRRCSAPRSPAS